jgi:hypothetical protein
MSPKLLLVPPVTPMPPIEHATDRGIPGVSGDPDLMIVMLFFQMFLVDLKALTLALFIGVVDLVAVVLQITPYGEARIWDMWPLAFVGKEFMGEWSNLGSL